MTKHFNPKVFPRTRIELKIFSTLAENKTLLSIFTHLANPRELLCLHYSSYMPRDIRTYSYSQFREFCSFARGFHYVETNDPEKCAASTKYNSAWVFSLTLLGSLKTTSSSRSNRVKKSPLSGPRIDAVFSIHLSQMYVIQDVIAFSPNTLRIFEDFFTYAYSIGG